MVSNNKILELILVYSVVIFPIMLIIEPSIIELSMFLIFFISFYNIHKNKNIYLKFLILVMPRVFLLKKFYKNLI